MAVCYWPTLQFIHQQMFLMEKFLLRYWKNIFLYSSNSDSDSEDVPLAVLQQKYKNSVEAVINQDTVALLQEVNEDTRYISEDVENWNKDVIQEPDA